MSVTRPISNRRQRLSGYSKPGAAPGILRRPPDAAETSIEATDYGPDSFERITAAMIDDVSALRDSHPLVWINVVGLSDVAFLRSLAERFSLHDLAMEDVFHTQQRPKSEEYDAHHFLLARIPLASRFPHTEQIALFMSDAFLICFQERPGNCFDAVRIRIAESRSRLRANASGFLAYALIDAVIDSYFPMLERVGDEVEEVETTVLSRNNADMMARLHRAKRNIVEIRRTIWPHRGDGQRHPAHERDHKGADRDRDDLHPVELHRERLRHELRPHRLALEHAGTGVGVRLRVRARIDGRRRGRVAAVSVPAQLAQPDGAKTGRKRRS